MAASGFHWYVKFSDGSVFTISKDEWNVLNIIRIACEKAGQHPTEVVGVSRQDLP